MTENQPPQQPITTEPGIVPAPKAFPTGRNVINREIERIVASQTYAPIHNQHQYPHYQHNVDVLQLYNVYFNQIKPLIYGNYRSLGARGITDVADTNLLNNCVRALATQAVVATHTVGFNKVKRIDALAAASYNSYPMADNHSYPTSVSTLITSFGPFELTTQVPYRCIHIPIIDWTDVTDLLNHIDYHPELATMALETISKSKLFSLTQVDTHATASSPWWLLHPHHTRDRNGQIEVLNVYSPFPFEDRDQALVIASFFIDELLVPAPAGANFTQTRQYNFNYEPTRVEQFPATSRSFPEFNDHQPAYHGTIQLHQRRARTPSPEYHPRSPTHLEEDEASPSAAVKKRKRPKYGKDIDDNTFKASILWYYYDCKVLHRESSSRRNTISTSINTV